MQQIAIEDKTVTTSIELFLLLAEFRLSEKGGNDIARRVARA